MNNKNFLKNFTIIGSGTFINMFLGVITTPIITRLVDPTEYGKLSIFTMYASIAVMILCLGLDQALVRFYYEHKGNREKRALLFKCVNMPVIITICVSFIVITLSKIGIIQFEFDTFTLILLCFYTFSEIIFRFSHLLIRLNFNSKLFALLNVLRKAIYVICAIPLILLINKNYSTLLIISTIIASVICLIISICAQANYWNIFKNRPSLCHVKRKELINYGYPYIISMGITTLFQAIDKISLNMYCSYSEVGIYSSTMTLVHIFSLVQTTFNSLWQPMAVEHYTNNPKDTSFYKRGNQAITVVMFFIGITLILIKDIFAILLGEQYREAAYILPFLIFNPIMYTISETTVCGLIFMKKSSMQIISGAGACIVNIIGNTLLVPALASQGAAISTGISYIVFFALRTILSNKYFYIDFKLKKFSLLTIIVVFYAFYNTFISFNIGSIIGYIVCISVLMILYKSTVIWGVGYIRDVLNSIIRKNNKV